MEHIAIADGFLSLRVLWGIGTVLFENPMAHPDPHRSYLLFQDLIKTNMSRIELRDSDEIIEPKNVAAG
jgi:hypothetical protein